MSKYQDRDLGMHRDITRRDFVNGVGAAVGGALVAPGWLSAQEVGPNAPGTNKYLWTPSNSVIQPNGST